MEAIICVGNVSLHGFSGSIRIKTIEGFKRLDQACPTEKIVNETGVWTGELVTHENVSITAIPFLNGHVSEDQIFRWGYKWIRAGQLFRLVPRQQFNGTLFCLTIHSSVERNHHYILSGGLVVHD